MNFRTLGRTQLNISEVGFGSWGISGNSYGTTSDVESINALNYAFDQGINFIDTADIYGFGHSEELVGKAIKGQRDNFTIATKGGWDFTQGAVKANYDPAYIREAIHSSLKRLNTDVIDVYQLHNPPDVILENPQPLLEQLKLAQKEGKIRFIGVSIFVPWQGVEWGKLEGVDVIQCIYNLIDQRVDGEFLSFSQEHNLGVIAREPLNCGVLTNKYSEEVEFPKNDHRRRWSPEKLKLMLQKLAVYKERFSSLKTNPVQFALSFVLQNQNISTVIPGCKTVSQVKENILASQDNIISEEMLEEIRHIYKEDKLFDEGFVQK